MPIQVRRVSADGVFIKMLLYGRPGAGKTTFCAQANDHPKLAPALFLSFEGGMLSVAGRGDVDEIEIRSIEDLEEVYLLLRSRDSRLAKYRTVIIDSASELYNRAIQEAVEERARSTKRRDVYEIEVGDYGKAGYQTNVLFRAFRDLPVNLLATAHPRFLFPQGANSNYAEPISVTPNFSDRLATSLMGIFDFVHYLYTWEETDDNGETVVRRGLLTSDRGAYRAKTRGPNFAQQLGQVVENPYLPSMYELLLQSEMAGSGGGPDIGHNHRQEAVAPESGQEASRSEPANTMDSIAEINAKGLGYGQSIALAEDMRIELPDEGAPKKEVLSSKK